MEAISNAELVDFFKERMDQKIKNNPFRDTFNIKEVLLENTCKPNKHENTKDEENIDLSPENKALHKIFHRTFSMWEAGKEREELYKNLYAFPPKDNTYDHLIDKNIFEVEEDLLPVNLNQNYTDYFVSCLCAKAKSIKDIDSDIYAANFSRFFLIGDIGTGKTTFLNYIFSRHYKQLNKRKVMWVRVDLTKSYHSDASLEDALSYQVSRIVRKNYYQDEFENDPDFISTIESQFSSLLSAGRVIKNEVDHYINDYISKYNKQRGKPYHELVQLGIKEYVENKFSMIYIYDGLDRLREGPDFTKKLKDLQNYIIGSEKSKHLYIFVMRTSSHAKWLNSYLLEEEKYRKAALRQVAKTFYILPPKLHDVVDRRINVLCKTWDRILYQHKHDIIIEDINKDVEDEDGINYEQLQLLMNSCRWIDTNKILAYYSVFLRFIFRGLTLSEKKAVIDYEWDKKKAYTSLKNVVGVNLRILLDVLSLLHKCFLQTLQHLDYSAEDVAEIENMLELHHDRNVHKKEFRNYLEKLRKILAKHYRVITILLKNRSSYIHHNNFTYDDKGKITLLPRNDGNRIPFIFSAFRGVNVKDKNKEHYNLLAKIRLLQFLKNNGPQSIEKIINSSVSFFGYKPDHIKLDFQELICMNMIAPITKKDESNDLYYNYEITRVGINTLEKLIFEYSYLRIIMDDIFIPKNICNQFSIERNSSFRDNPFLLSISHVPRVAKFIFLINETETQEKAFYVTTTGKHDFDSSWAISNKIFDAFMETVPKLVAHKRNEFRMKSYDIFKKI